MDKKAKSEPVTVTIEQAANAPLEVKSPPLSPHDHEVKLEQYREKFDRIADENFVLKEENSRLRRENRTSEALDALIKPFSKNAFQFMVGYSSVVALALFLNGFGLFTNPISDSVMQFLVGSTAVTVIGLVGMVLTGVFVSRPK